MSLQVKSDIVIIGSGLAGLSLALKATKKLPGANISILSKAGKACSNSNFAQGGIAVVTNQEEDSFEAHIGDTLASGRGLSDPAIVKKVVEAAPDRLQELLDYGVDFTLNPSGFFDLGLEGGHSKPRIVRAEDNVGNHLMKTLIPLARSFENISFYEHHFCTEIVKTESGKVAGVNVLDTEKKTVTFFSGKIVVLASGGSGQVYKNTTNPKVATGDGIAMGVKAGAQVSHLHYVQFHPTALFEKNKTRLDLISEAVRGFGAHVVNKKGQGFLFDYDERGELATRDIVSKAIFNELKNSGEKCAYLDCRHLDYTEFKAKFPSISTNLTAKGFIASKALIPIVPAAHYQCGGLKVNEKGATNIKGLYALGECAETGLHGANRLASNSLLEAMVFAHEAAEHIALHFDENTVEEPVSQDLYRFNEENDAEFEHIAEAVKQTMSRYANISSEVDDFQRADKKITRLTHRFYALGTIDQISEKRLIVRNMLLTATGIIQGKLNHCGLQVPNF